MKNMLKSNSYKIIFGIFLIFEFQNIPLSASSSISRSISDNSILENNHISNKLNTSHFSEYPLKEQSTISRKST